MQNNQEPPTTLTLPTHAAFTYNIVLCAVVVLLVTVLVAVLVLGGSIMWRYTTVVNRHYNTSSKASRRSTIKTNLAGLIEWYALWYGPVIVLCVLNLIIIVAIVVLLCK